MRESILSQLITCKACGKTYHPQNDVCGCVEEPPKVEWEHPQEGWHDKLTETDCYP